MFLMIVNREYDLNFQIFGAKLFYSKRISYYSHNQELAGAKMTMKCSWLFVR